MLLSALNRPINYQIPIIELTSKKVNSEEEIKMLLEQLSSKQSSLNSGVPLKNYHSLNWNWLRTETDKQMYSQDLKSVCLHPYCAGCFKTDGVRVEQAIKRNAYTYWVVEVNREALSGTSTMIGIGRANKKLSSIGYLNLIGMDEDSWGLSNKGLLWHKNTFVKYCDQIDDTESVRIGCLFDGFSGRLSFFLNDKFMGVAFENIPLNEPLYPMITSTVSKSLFKLEFVCETFPSLQDICKSNIIKNISYFNQGDIPNYLISYLKNY
ncbi:unnamed protein product [Brachionus calyciflorus]|uniref:B30.2/SPRY domain-containing protein n=1 Tax=Brachionus calyciflorus TaxID=104777 RepID=A0A813SJX0_9BILA|nr:unnamed protein product [Brachionus calyciflorus]